MTAASDDTIIHADSLFRHSRRPAWGLAILTSEDQDHRVFQFQDGSQRSFKRGYYHLLEEADLPFGEAEAALTELRSAADLTNAREKRREESGRELVTVADQMLVFTSQFPDGFKDPAWLSGVRGAEAPRRLKRHRSPAIAQAQERLAKEVLDELLEAGKFSEIHQAIIDVLQATSLVQASKEVKPLAQLPVERHEALARAVRDVLWGDGAPDVQFDTWLRALGGSQRPQWSLATAIPALVHPHKCLFVQPSAVRAQARQMAPRLNIAKEPQWKVYDRLCTMATAVAKVVRDAGHEPQDLLDIHDFMWTSLRPAAIKTLKDLKRAKRAAS